MLQQPSAENILRIATGYWQSKALLSAVELGVFTELAKGEKSAEELCRALPLHIRGARDLLDALSSMGLLGRKNGRYANSCDAAYFLDRARSTYMGDFLDMVSSRSYPFWGRLTEALRTGSPQNESREAGDAFDGIYSNPIVGEQFARAMTGASIPVAASVASAFPWKEYRSFVDVGCAEGGCAVILAEAHPHLTGTGFDLPPVASSFRRYVRSRGLEDRLKFVEGDFTADLLPHADVVVMGHLLPDWDERRKLLLLERAYEALPKGGALVTYDAIIDSEREKNTFGLLMSLNMVVETRGGFEYTVAQFHQWTSAAGFSESRIEPLGGAYSMGVAIK